MSKRFCRLTTTATAIAVVLIAVVALADKPQKPARESVRVARSSYTIVQGGKETGAENIVRTDYNDNTITFASYHVLTPSPGVKMEQNVEFTVEEESFFPKSYRMKKEIVQGESGMKMEIDIDMYANVAVLTTRTPNATGSRNIVAPTGAALIETGVVYVYYQLLFWYDRELGGRQNFDVMEASSGKHESVVMQFLTRETIMAGDVEYETDLFLIQRNQFDIKCYVDDAGRIIRVDQNFMIFDLKEWSEE